jgi:uncharacterized protein (DUF433 family)
MVKAIISGGGIRPLEPLPADWQEGQPLRVDTADEGKGTAADGCSLPLHAIPPPLRVDEGGVVRVGKSRVSLDVIVDQYENGMTPEEMVRSYDTLVLADVHATIAYYLRHRDEVRAYLKRREEEADALRVKIEAERPRVSRKELLARRSAREKDNAPTGQ